MEFQNAGQMRSDLLFVLTPVKVKNLALLDRVVYTMLLSVLQCECISVLNKYSIEVPFRLI